MKFVFLLAAFIPFLQGHSQLPDYHVQLFDESFGIRTSDMRRVIRDKQGFVWIMNSDRLQRFDGKYVKDFFTGPSLNSIICDSDGRIWASSFHIIYRFIDDHRGFIPVPLDTIQPVDIFQIYNLREKGIWALTTKGFYVLDTARMIFIKHPDTSLGNFNKSPGVTLDNGQNTQTIFFEMADSLRAFQMNAGHFLKPLPIGDIRRVCALSDDLAFVSTWSGGLYMYDFSKSEIRTMDMSRHLTKVQDYFLCVYQARPEEKGTFLLATSKGLLEYNMTTGNFRQIKLYHKGKPLEGNFSFIDLYTDHEGTAWILYDNYGLISLEVHKHGIGLLRNYETDITKAWDNNVRNFAEDDKGNLWLATLNGFARMDLSNGAVWPHFAKEGATDKINYNSIRGIAFDGGNIILGQTSHGTWIYNPETDSYRRPVFSHDNAGEATSKRMETDFIIQIYKLSNGDHLIASRDGGYVMDGKTYTIHDLDISGKRYSVRFAYQDSKKNIWIGTPGPLYCLDSNLISQHIINQSETFGVVKTLCEWNDGSLIGGGTGLHRINISGSSPVISDVNPFFDHIDIRIVYKDHRDKLWLATSEGLFRYDILTQKIELFSHFENLEGNSFYPNSYCYTKDSLLFLGSSKGIIYFKPEQVEEEKDSLNIFLTNVTINADDSTYTATSSPFKLKYFQNAIAFDLLIPYFGNANKLRYRYRMQGLNDEWLVNGNNNTVRFHALQPGKYIFQASASINGVDWFGGKQKIAFEINPPFWKTWWFYALVVSLITGALYAIYRYQLNKKLEVERLRMGIARDLHDDIGSALSNIHIISSMAMKQQPDNGTATKVFHKIKESSKTILENMQDIVWAINPDNDTVEQVLAKMKEFAGELCESAGIEYEFETDEDLGTIELNINKRKDLFLVFKESINNAVKYSGCAKIYISLHKKPNGWVTLKLRDDGTGFVREEIQPGNGLRNMQERAKEANGQIQIESSTRNGTMVEFRIPIT